MFASLLLKLLYDSYTIEIKKQPKFRCSAAILNTQGDVAMETELHWPEMKASEDLDFHCTSIFNRRLFLHQPSHQLHIITTDRSKVETEE